MSLGAGFIIAIIGGLIFGLPWLNEFDKRDHISEAKAVSVARPIAIRQCHDTAQAHPEAAIDCTTLKNTYARFDYIEWYARDGMSTWGLTYATTGRPKLFTTNIILDSSGKPVTQAEVLKSYSGHDVPVEPEVHIIEAQP